jgi:hypothetical protein
VDNNSGDLNPFAPPKVDTEPRFQPPTSSGAWAEGQILVVLREGITLPSRCVKCNADCSEPGVRRKFYWHSQLLYLLIFVYVFLYVIVALIVRKKATVVLSVCGTCRTKRRKRMLLWATPMLLSLPGYWVVPHDFFPIVLVSTFFVALVGVLRAAQILRVQRIDKTTARFSGAGSNFLTQLAQRSIVE